MGKNTETHAAICNLRAIRLPLPAMKKELVSWVFYGVLGFHLLATAYSFYTFFILTTGTGLYQVTPFLILLFALAWVGIVFKKRWCAFGYFLLILYELAMRFFFGKMEFGQVFGDVLFPLDLIFLVLLAIGYRDHFNSTESAT